MYLFSFQKTNNPVRLWEFQPDSCHNRKKLFPRPLHDFLNLLEKHLTSFSAHGERIQFRADFMQQTKLRVKHADINAPNYLVIQILLL